MEKKKRNPATTDGLKCFRVVCNKPTYLWLGPMKLTPICQQLTCLVVSKEIAHYSLILFHTWQGVLTLKMDNRLEVFRFVDWESFLILTIRHGGSLSSVIIKSEFYFFNNFSVSPTNDGLFVSMVFNFFFAGNDHLFSFTPPLWITRCCGRRRSQLPAENYSSFFIKTSYDTSNQTLYILSLFCRLTREVENSFWQGGKTWEKVGEQKKNDCGPTLFFFVCVVHKLMNEHLTTLITTNSKKKPRKVWVV